MGIDRVVLAGGLEAVWEEGFRGGVVLGGGGGGGGHCGYMSVSFDFRRLVGLRCFGVSFHKLPFERFGPSLFLVVASIVDKSADKAGQK